MTVFFLIFGVIAMLIIVCGLRLMFATDVKSKFVSPGPVRNPYDTQRLRRELLASARNDEELEYLRELDTLDLHRRHLIC